MLALLRPLFPPDCFAAVSGFRLFWYHGDPSYSGSSWSPSQFLGAGPDHNIPPLLTIS
jgi:hypothetical protein